MYRITVGENLGWDKVGSVSGRVHLYSLDRS